MVPSEARGPVIVAGLVLCSDASFQVPPRFQELPLAVEEPSLTVVPLLTERSWVSVECESSVSKPVPVLCQAVLWSRVSERGFLLWMNPRAVLLKAMLLRTVWLPGIGVSPPPSLNPLPSPAKLGKFQRLTPLPQAMLFSMRMGERSSHASKPSSTLFHNRAPRTRLPVPEPSLMARPSALSPFLRGSRFMKLSRLMIWLLLDAPCRCSPLS